MIKAIKKKLSVKIFLITAVLLIAACSGTFFCISKMLPSTYANELNQNIEEKALQLVKALSKQDKLEDCHELIKQFKFDTGGMAWIEDESENTLYSDSIDNNFGTITGDTITSFDANQSGTKVSSAYIQNAVSRFPFSLKNGDTYILAVQADMKIVNQAMTTLLEIFPYVLSIVLALSLLCSIFYSWYITRPVIRLSAMSERMMALDFSKTYDSKREDELGILAGNLNNLSHSLSKALTELETANKQLKTDIEKEREAEQSRIDFFAAASHELKTPLTILKGHLSGMLDGISGYENHKQYLSRSLSVTGQMETLVKELLYLSKDKVTNQPINFVKADLSEIIRVQLAELTDLITSNQQTLDVNIPEQLFCVINSSQIARAIQNILVNAIRYSPNGEQIRIIAIESENDVVCSIENTGVHIDEHSIPHLFDAFYRTEASRNKSSGGTGLGLYIVRDIFENHHAKYSIRNTENGVKFTFCLKKTI